MSTNETRRRRDAAEPATERITLAETGAPSRHTRRKPAECAPGFEHCGPGELTVPQRADRRAGPGERRTAASVDAPLRSAAQGSKRPARPLRKDWLRRLPQVPSLAAMWSGPASAPWRSLLLERADEAARAAGATLESAIVIESLSVTHEDHPIAGFRVAARLGEENGACEARICPNLCAALLESLTRSPAAPISTHPDPVTAAVLGHGALVLCKAVGEAGVAHPRLLSTGSIDAAALSLNLRVRLGGKLGHMQIRLDEAAARSLTRMLDEEARRGDASSPNAPDRRSADGSKPALLPPARIEALHDLPVLARVSMGPVKLTAATLSALRPGDAICPDPRARLVDGMPAGPVFLSASTKAAGRLAAIGVLEGGNISITTLGRIRPTAEESTMKSTLPSHGALAIDVHVVLDTLPMTLAELSRVGPGTVLSLSGPAPRVKLKVGEETIAVGELVDVEGILGVRILEGASR